MAAHFIDPAANNAVVSTPAAVTVAARVYGIDPHAWWTTVRAPS